MLGLDVLSGPIIDFPSLPVTGRVFAASCPRLTQLADLRAKIKPSSYLINVCGPWRKICKEMKWELIHTLYTREERLHANLEQQ